MKNLWLIILFTAACSAQHGPDIIYPAPIAEVSREILPPDIETASGANN